MKSLRLKKDFDLVYKKGRSIRGKLLLLRFVFGTGSREVSCATVVGLKVSKKAVERNKLKRRVREVLRKNIKDAKSGSKIIFTALPGSAGASYKDIKEEVVGLCRKANII